MTTPRALALSLSEVAEESHYRLLKIRRSRSAGLPLVEIELAGPEPPPGALLDALQAKAEEGMNCEIRLRVRTLLETERTR